MKSMCVPRTLLSAVWCAAALLAGLVTASAGSDTNKTCAVKWAILKPSKPAGQADREIELTGSHIKQKVNRNGRITDGFSPVSVIDRAEIDRSGGATVRQVLGLTNIR